MIVTGLSGAGKSTALRALEDIEFTCVDNIPVPLVIGLVDHLAHEGDRDKLAIAIDSRQRRNLTAWQGTLAQLRGAGHRLEVMFLDASDEVLLRRFSETRRRHPLSGDDLSDGVRRDREVMAELRQGAAVVDTSNLNSRYSLTLGLGRFFDPDTTSPILLGLIGRIDVFTIWITVLIAIGLAVTGKISRGKAAIAAAIVWLVGALPTLAGTLRQ